MLLKLIKLCGTSGSRYDAILSVAPTLNTSTEESVDGMQRDAKLEKEGLSLFTGFVAIPLAWCPCLSGGKHHAVCMDG